MVNQEDVVTDVPGTVYLVDRSLANAAHARNEDVLLIPQPTNSAADPLNWPKCKKYWSLFLISTYACVQSFGENNWGAAWTTISEEADVTLENMNGGSALNYLLLGFLNIIWIPTAMKLGRKIVYILSLCLTVASGIWGGFFYGTGQYYIMLAINGVGTAAYQALIQLTIFDMFFAHERGRMVAVYIFGQQLGSILGLILGGYIADGIGWRWSSPLVAIAAGILIVLFIFTFDDTMFPRHRSQNQLPQNIPPSQQDDKTPLPAPDDKTKHVPVSLTPSQGEGEIIVPPRKYLQRAALWHYFPDDKTTWFQYFRRPFYLFAFPNIVLSGIQFAFGCTAGIVSFNTISEIMTEPPYNWSVSAAGLMFLAAIVGDFVGMAIGSLSDTLIIFLARRNNGFKEPEMRLWMFILPFVAGGVGYFSYGWCAQAGASWIGIAFGLGCMIAQQVAATTIATTYAMECFDGVSGELVVVLAICSSVINFAMSFSVQPLIDRTNYGWAFTFFGILVLLSMLMAVPMITWGKRWRRMCKGRYEAYLREVEGGGSD
ncbi:putative MFS transporter [Paecilomyces variotii]|uniref:Putative MFS transporter n=1 Tax=Byssochlamys spectabilis TaxID=264951 RepID=A0A443I3Q3_BYSSP|nr:putative MFS transporter [Paecilomyces variotii]RWQ98656.1 putative MFS transporter [Paecilomyces variotii]